MRPHSGIEGATPFANASVTNPLNGVEMQVTGNPVKLSGMPDEIGPVPEKGQHNWEVYAGWLGYSEERVKELTAQQVI